MPQQEPQQEPQPEPSTAHDDRLTRVEESLGFAEHASARLEALVTDLSGQVYDLATRLERMERKLSDLQTDVQSGQGVAGEVPNDPPPHSHRPL